MKIALIDNMNNHFFSLARYLDDLGCEVTVFGIPNTSQKHFLPEADSFNKAIIGKLFKFLPFKINNYSWLFFPKKKIQHTFAEFDFIVSCGTSSAYLYRAGFNNQIILPYGSDLYAAPFPQLANLKPLNIVRYILAKWLAKFQRLAYQNASIITLDDFVSLYREAARKLDINYLNLSIPMLYNKEDLNDKSNAAMWSFLDNHDFIVFNHSRQLWSTNGDNMPDFDKYGGIKGNDRIIKAFAKFTAITKYKNPILVLFNYGDDVEDSKKLIDSLGIVEQVKWMPLSNRKNILYGLGKANFASNSFRENIPAIGNVTFEALAMQAPLISGCQEIINDPEHRFYQAPIIHALTEDEILEIFKDYELNPQKYIDIGKSGKAWFDKNLGIQMAKKYIELFNLLAKKPTANVNTPEVRSIFEK